jgi:hypothetical protein
MVRNLPSNSQRPSGSSSRSSSRPSSRLVARRMGMGAMGGLMTLITLGYPLQAQAEVNSVQFEMYPVAQFVPCLAKPGLQPKVRVTVVRGELNDHLKVLKKALNSICSPSKIRPSCPMASPIPTFKRSLGWLGTSRI